MAAQQDAAGCARDFGGDNFLAVQKALLWVHIVRELVRLWN